jgi:hypothetical protein
MNKVTTAVAPSVKSGRIVLPEDCRRRVNLVRHGQTVQILGEVPGDASRYIVAGEGIRGEVPVFKRYVDVFES